MIRYPFVTFLAHSDGKHRKLRPAMKKFYLLLTIPFYQYNDFLSI